MDGVKIQLDDRTAASGANRLTLSSKRYDEWNTMHDGVIWFDTAGCLSGAKIGEVNAATVAPTTRKWKKEVQADPINCVATNPWDCHRYVDMTDNEDVTYTRAPFVQPEWKYATDYNPGPPSSDWWTTNEQIYNVQYDTNTDKPLYHQVSGFDVWGFATQVDTSNYNYEEGNKGTDLSVDGRTINWNDEDLYRDLLKDYIDLIEDCDIDCQKAGSQLTLIAGLMGTSYGIVALNAIFMFVGTWRYRWRFCSVICTAATCLIQLILSIVVGALLFTKYNAVCARSMVKTYGENMIWTMADDFYVTFSLWIVSFFAMMFFCCCGLCQAYRPMKD